MSGMEQLREAVLQAKDIAQELPQGAALDREAFIQACTRAARNYVAQPQLAGNADAFRDIVRREVHLALASAGLIHGDHKAAIRGGGSSSPATTARGTPRVAATPRTARTTPQKATSASTSVAATPRSASCASTEKVEALKAIKPYLEPAFRSGALSREDFSAIALRLTDSFCDRFRTNAASAGASVSDTERQWIQTMVQREIDVVTQAVAAANASTPSVGRANNASGYDAAASPSRLGSSGAGAAAGGTSADSGSPFERHIRKLREFVETSEQDDSAGAPAAGPHAASRGGSANSGSRRAVLVSEISHLQQQLAAISAQLGDKVAELATLE